VALTPGRKTKEIAELTGQRNRIIPRLMFLRISHFEDVADSAR
jgi:hypothetical protein